MRFHILGCFEVANDGIDHVPGPPKLRQALALLVVHRNEVVSAETLMAELWPSSRPERATRIVHTYIYELRRLLRAAGAGPDMLRTRPGGYLLSVGPDGTDVAAFEELAREGTESRAAGDLAGAADALSRALALWRGRALADVDRAELLEAEARRLEEARLRVLDLRIEADFALNRHRELIGELKALALANPFHEDLHGKLMLALYRSGRRSEALDAYQHLRHNLVDKLGLEPGREIGRLQQAVLAADPALDPTPLPTAAGR